MAKYNRAGENINYLNTGSATLLEGTVVPIGAERVGVVAGTIAPNEVGTVWVSGIWMMDKGAGAIALGDAVAYDAGTGKIGKPAVNGEGVPTGEDVPAGWAVQAAGASDATVLVKIG